MTTKDGAAEKTLGLLGFAQKAGRLVVGTELVCNAIRSAKPRTYPRIVLIASDASANTVKRVENICKYYECKCARISVDSQSLGQRIGKMGSVATVGVADDGFAKAIKQLVL